MTPRAFLTTITFTGLSMLGMALVLLAAGDWLAEQWNPFTAATHASARVGYPVASGGDVARELANAYGTGLSPAAEPLRVSSASPLPSLSQGE